MATCDKKSFLLSMTYIIFLYKRQYLCQRDARLFFFFQFESCLFDIDSNIFCHLKLELL